MLRRGSRSIVISILIDTTILATIIVYYTVTVFHRSLMLIFHRLASPTSFIIIMRSIDLFLLNVEILFQNGGVKFRLLILVIFHKICSFVVLNVIS